MTVTVSAHQSSNVIRIDHAVYHYLSMCMCMCMCMCTGTYIHSTDTRMAMSRLLIHSADVNVSTTFEQNLPKKARHRNATSSKVHVSVPVTRPLSSCLSGTSYQDLLCALATVVGTAKISGT